VIHEVDESLRLLMRREALQGADVEIVFDAPTKEWAGRRNTPTINMYLYDIREDMHRRHEGMMEVRNELGRVVSRKPPPRFFKLSYLLTAWTQRPEDEHRLLSACLAAYLKYQSIAPEFLVGSLEELNLEVPVLVAVPPPQDRSISDIWTALGGELKPSLDIVVMAPCQTGRDYHIGPPLVEAPIVGFREADPKTKHRTRVGPDGKLVPMPKEAPPDGEGAKPARRRKKGAPDDTTMAEAWDETDEHEVSDPEPEEFLMASDDGTGRVFKVQGVPRRRP
jgi:hypothetical protein